MATNDPGCDAAERHEVIERLGHTRAVAFAHTVRSAALLVIIGAGAIIWWAVDSAAGGAAALPGDPRTFAFLQAAVRTIPWTLLAVALLMEVSSIFAFVRWREAARLVARVDSFGKPAVSLVKDNGLIDRIVRLRAKARTHMYVALGLLALMCAISGWWALTGGPSHLAVRFGTQVMMIVLTFLAAGFGMSVLLNHRDADDLVDQIH